MSKRKKLIVARISLVFGILPFLIYAYETGPDPRRTGAPGDATCLQSGCHTGTLTGPGNAKIVLPGGNTYVPGVKQHIMVQITDSTRQKFGFELTARLASDLKNGQAGDFTTTDALTQVVCDDGSNKVNGKPCSAQFPVQFIEHTLAGFNASTTGAYTYQFDWTPPATNVGNVTLYVAANAGPGGQPTTANADIYLANVVLTPTTSAPPVTINSVQDAESARTTLVPGQWAAIYGANLANPGPPCPPNSVRVWCPADFTGGTAPGSPLPTSLDGTSVTFNGIPAAVYYILPSQMAVQVPALPVGTASVIVTNNGAVSAAFTATITQSAPSFYANPIGSVTYPAAYIYGVTPTTYVGDPATAGAGYQKAHPGGLVIMYVNGLTMATAGQVVSPGANLAAQVTVMAGTTSLPVSYAALVAAGEFQLNVTIPATLATGSYPLTVSYQGQSSPSGVTLPVGP